MAEGLKPCPFCGQDKWMQVWDSLVDMDLSVVHLWRVSCSAAMGRKGCGGSSGVMATRELAIEAWNRRANDDGADDDIRSDRAT